MNRVSKLNKLFNDVLRGNTSVDVRNHRRFIEAVLAQKDAAACVHKLAGGDDGPKALQQAMRLNLSPDFLNGEATSLIAYLLKIKDIGEDMIKRLIVPIVDPPIFWSAFSQAFEHGELAEQGQRAFAGLLLYLVSLDTELAAEHRSFAGRSTVQDRLLSSPYQDIREIGYHIKQIVSTYHTQNIVAFDGASPGGRHDNDDPDFRKISILPTADEVLCTEPPFLRSSDALEDPNTEETRVKDYLDNTFRLLRDDMVHEIQEAVQIVLGKTKGFHRGAPINGLKLLDIYCGKDEKRTRWGVKLECSKDFSKLPRGAEKEKERILFLQKDPVGSKILRHQTLMVIISNGDVVGFGTVHRDEQLLAMQPPVIVLQLAGQTSTQRALRHLNSNAQIQLVPIDVAIFAFEPVLKALQKVQVVPLSEELLFWKPHDIIGAPRETASRIVRALEQDPSQDLMPLLGTPTPIRLDESQAASLLTGLTQRVSLIQGPPGLFSSISPLVDLTLGPPGTGKSFIGALLAKAFHNFTSQRLLVVCYTNHALDQFLEDLMNIGIPSVDIVRLGSRANDKVSHLDIQKQRGQRFPRDWKVIDTMKQRSRFLVGGLTTAFRYFTTRDIQLSDLQMHLEFDEPSYYDAFLVPESDDGMIRVGHSGRAVEETYLIDRWAKGLDAGIFNMDPNIVNAHGIWSMSKDARERALESWIAEISKQQIDEIYRCGKDYDKCEDDLSREFSKSDVAIMKEKKIIACTTTGAAKYTEAIRAAEPDILLAEEAGEILEAHILTALCPKTSQIVLIGDHKQLRPKVNNYRLTVEKGDGYDLNRSLFERLVLKGFPHETLKAQHRMRPEISAFVRELTYPDLRDAPQTTDREDIHGLQNNIIFINHQHPEVADIRTKDRSDKTSTTSKRNEFEVQMTVKIVRYIGQQGYGTDKIVVLTPYLGQLADIRNALKNTADPVLNALDSYDLLQAGLLSPFGEKTKNKSIRLATIDNYQGEESDIVIVSLTRSNPLNDIGFMDSPERLNVLISRARNGLIFIGNSKTFLSSRKGKHLWSKFITLLRRGGHFYNGLPVKCERHPDQVAMLERTEDFDELCPDGGCSQPCGAKLRCKIHKCPLKCHLLQDHSRIQCNYPMFAKCPSIRHNLTWTCYQTKPSSCKQCAKEAERIEKDHRRELELLKKQLEQQAEHEERMAEQEEMLKAKAALIADAEASKQRSNMLREKQKEIEATKVKAEKAIRKAKNASASSAPEQTGLSPASAPTSSFPTPSQHTELVSDPTATQKASAPAAAAVSPTNSRAWNDWQHQKHLNGERNESIDKIMDMTGLEEVKLQILRIKAYIDQKKRQGIKLNDERLNIVLLGNPGTGKTTVARLFTQFLESIEVLPGDAFIETTGASLAYEGVGGAKGLINRALTVGGGAIFIDEAYQLVNDYTSSGKQVLEFLLAEMENHIGTLVFVFAGYNREMEKFFEHNPGLKSRIPYTLQFQDYSDEELLTMLEALVVRRYEGRMKVDDGVRGLYTRIAVRRLGRGRGRPGFGNARALQNMFARVCERQAERVEKDRKARLPIDDFVLLKEDLIGPDPSSVFKKSMSWEKLQKLIGLDAVKESIRNLFMLIETNYYRELSEEEPLQMSLNCVFLGSPGTGKTTVAKLYGQILGELGLLSNGEVISKNPSDFIGSHLGHSEKNTRAILQSTLGKVLVIDEAYMLYTSGADHATGHQDSFRAAVIDTLVAEVQNIPGDDRCVILLGYKDRMEEMFQNVNPGLSRRFAVENAFYFDDFTLDQLLQVLDLKLAEQNLEATDEAKGIARDLLSRAKNRPHFGNAGEVENMLGLAKKWYQKRQAGISPRNRARVVFKPQDFDPDYDRHRHAHANLVKLFEDMVACEDIIQKFDGYQQVARKMKAKGLDVREQIPMSFLFKGPPGTGKTTVARKLGQIYYDIGLLSSNEVVECSASDLVGQYVGHTGPKTKKVFEKALGKVLFVDEAYRLGDGHFAKEAMDELVGLMTQEPFVNKLVIILAGYDQEMNTLLKVNTGLSSRFSEVVMFRNVSAQHCLQLLDSELRKKKIFVNELSDVASAAYLEMRATLDRMSHLPSWGNARNVKEIGKVMIQHAFNGSGDDPSLTAQEAIGIMKRMLSELRDRQNVPRAFQGAPLMPVASQSVDSHPPPPPAQTIGSAAKNNSSSPPVSRPASPHSTQSNSRDTSPEPSKSQQAPSQQAPSQPSSSPSRPSSVVSRSGRGAPAASATRSWRQNRKAQALRTNTQRDRGVSDTVWNQLQVDKNASETTTKQQVDAERKLQQQLMQAIEIQKKAEASIQQLAPAGHSTSWRKTEEDEVKRQREAARLRAVEAKIKHERAAALLKAEQQKIKERNQQEAEVQQKLRRMGVCPQGYQWIPQVGGYRCAGGAHFVSHARMTS